MKSKIAFTLLLVTMFLFPGCYTVLLVEDTTESTSIELAPTPQPTVEYIPVYYPVLIQIPEPPHYLPPAMYVSDSPSSTPPSSDDRRLTHTGRSSPISNPAQVRNDENNRPTRDSGVQRVRR